MIFVYENKFVFGNNIFLYNVIMKSCSLDFYYICNWKKNVCFKSLFLCKYRMSCSVVIFCLIRGVFGLIYVVCIKRIGFFCEVLNDWFVFVVWFYFFLFGWFCMWFFRRGDKIIYI